MTELCIHGRKENIHAVLCYLLFQVVPSINCSKTNSLYLAHPLQFFIWVPNLWSILCNSEAKGKEITHNADLSHTGLLLKLVSNFDRSVAE